MLGLDKIVFDWQATDEDILKREQKNMMVILE